MSTKSVKIALLGNPNSGKTSLFNLLTGLRQKVGNFPGVTVEKKVGICQIGESRQAQLTDFPGSYSLYPTSFDERMAVSTLTDPSNPDFPDAIVYVANVTTLERHTLLLMQLRELGLPILLALNMSDVAEREGIKIDIERLERKLQLPVVSVSGRSGFGLDVLKKQLGDMLDSQLYTKLSNTYSQLAVERKAVSAVQDVLPNLNPYQSLLVAHHHEWLPHISDEQKTAIANQLKDSGFESLKLQVHETMARYDTFTPLLRSSVKHVLRENTASDRIDEFVTHPILGPLIFIGLLFLIFQAIFAWSALPMEWIESSFNYLIEGTKMVLPPTAWYTRLLTEGVLAGLSGIVIFVPQIAILFFLIGILEEAGYMARAVFIFDRLMQQFGLNGRSIVALVSGGACAIPAIMSARTISNWKERLITIMVTPLVSCSARIPIYIIMIALVVPQVQYGPFSLQGLVFAGLYVLGVVAALGSAYVFKKVLKSEERSYLMMELPPYRTPQFRNVLQTVREKTLAFVSEAGKVIILISIILWFLASYGPATDMASAETRAQQIANTQQLDEKQTESLTNSLKLEASYAGHIGKAIEPVIEPLGYNWKIGIALLTSFAAREVFVGTMATLYSIGSAEDEYKVTQRLAKEKNPDTGEQVYNVPTVASLLIFYVFAMQCMGTLAVVRKETGGWKWPIIQFVFMTALAYLSALVVYQGLS